jgi:hypothetical protein
MNSRSTPPLDPNRSQPESIADVEGADTEGGAPARAKRSFAALLVVLLLAGAIWLGSRSLDNGNVTENAMMGGTVLPVPAATSVAPSSGASLPLVTRTFFLPDDQGVLQPHSVRDAMTERAATTKQPVHAYEAEATRTVRLLLQRAPQEFPADTRLLGIKVDGAHRLALVDFAPGFSAPAFWQGSTRIEATIQALVKTLLAVTPKVVDKVQFLEGGKPIELLGDYDASAPIGAGDAAVTEP